MNRVITAVGIVFILVVLSSCAARLPIIEYRDKEVIKNRIDTIIQRDVDSVYVKETVKNDTVFIEKYKEKIRFKDKIVISIDTVRVNEVQTIQVKAPRTLYERVFITIAWVVIAFVLLKIVIFAVKIVRKFGSPI